MPESARQTRPMCSMTHLAAEPPVSFCFACFSVQ